MVWEHKECRRQRSVTLNTSNHDPYVEIKVIQRQAVFYSDDTKFKKQEQFKPVNEGVILGIEIRISGQEEITISDPEFIMGLKHALIAATSRDDAD